MVFDRHGSIGFGKGASVDPLQIVLFVVAGFLIGIFGGLLGIGGGTLMVPILRLGFAFEAVVATATSLFTIIFTSIGGTVTHIRNKTALPKLSLCLGVGGALTSSIGAYLGNISPSWAIILVAVLIIGYSAFNMLRKALKLPKRQGRKDADNRSGDVPVAPERLQRPMAEEWRFTFKRGLAGFGIGLIAGLAGGYVGVGGGFIMVPLMTSWLAVPMHKAGGTSLLAIMILAIPGVATQIALGNVDFVAGACLAVGSIPGAMVGARFVTRIPERELRFIFAGFLAIAAVSLFLNELGLM